MKKNVFTDGNGSNLIMVEGMGAYAPAHELDAVKRELEDLKRMVITDKDGHTLDFEIDDGVIIVNVENVDYLKQMQASAVELLKSLDNVPSFRERLKGLDRPTDFAIEQAKGDELSRFHNINARAKEFLFMLENGLGPEDMKGGNREDVE
ncbi:hypothetical protein vBVpP1_59 [Vibrio phage vB_VpP_1]|nr:hypothetical protein vBVpP1_59 [Vibrio phage vB_VpP_1]